MRKEGGRVNKKEKRPQTKRKAKPHKSKRRGAKISSPLPKSNEQESLQNGGALRSIQLLDIPQFETDDQKLWSVYWIGGLVDTQAYSLPKFVSLRK